jgi:hypothetical protein
MSDTRMAMAQRTLNGVLAITGGLLLAVSAFRPWIRSTPGGLEARGGLSSDGNLRRGALA